MRCECTAPAGASALVASERPHRHLARLYLYSCTLRGRAAPRRARGPEPDDTSLKTLLILRHAKSSHDDPKLSDHDRPLAKRGKRASKKIARLMDREGLWPERILSSTATRAASTIRRVIQASAEPERNAELVEFRRELYTFDAGEYVDAVRATAGDERSLMIVGHNPGLENLVYYLSGEHRRFPTAALARIELSIDAWDRMDRGTGTLRGLWLPRELDLD